MAKKKQTKTQQRISNLLRQISRMEKRGYSFPTDIRETVKGLSPQKARFFTTDTLYERSAFHYKFLVGNELRGYEVQEEIVSGTEGRAIERSLRSKKSAETRKKKRLPVPPEEDTTDATDDVLKNFSELITWLESAISETGRTLKGKEVPKSLDLLTYGSSVKRYISTIFYDEMERDKGALAERIYTASSDIDMLVGAIEYSMYKETIRQAGNQLISIIRGTPTLSRADRVASEAIANATDSYEEV